jgi:hypothetical protein
MANHTGWEELASENERLTGLADSHDRVPAGTAMSAAAAGPAAHGAAKTAGGGSGSLATRSPSSRTRFTLRLRQYLKGVCGSSRWPARWPACSSPRSSARMTFLGSRRVACPA